ncbi:MAG: cyclic pyranopterin monophosphate synthase MoaC [Nitrososphaeria archaeon]
MNLGIVDVSTKPVTKREAIAEGKIFLKKETIKIIKEGKVEKGDPIQIAIISAINTVKKTSELIPFCHPVPIEDIKIKFDLSETIITVRVYVKSHSKTGVEMEALTGVFNALLNIWDVVKKYEKDESGQYPTTLITDVRVLSKVKGNEKL